MSLTSINSEQPRPLGRRRRRNETCLRITDFLVAFSLIANVKKIFSTGGKSNLHHHKNTTSNTDALHGIRVLMMMWIIAGHSYAFAMQWLFFRNPKEMKSAPKNLISQIFANGTFSTDSFLFISGLLVTNLCMKHMRKMNGKMNLIGFYVHRYLRMTPLMMAVIAFAANLLKYVSEGPSFQGSTVMFDSWCKKNWWINALYLHNFVNSDNMCLAHTWYSAVDMQLYFITPLILIPLYHRPRIGFGIMSLLLTASMAFTAFITIRRHLPAVPYMNDMIAPDVVKDYYASVYIKPYTRIGPYLIGMALGFVLHTLEGKIRLSKTQAIAGWIFAVTANLGVLFAMLPVNAIPGYELPDVLAGIYSSTSRVVWALSLAWITFACSAGKGGLLGSMLSSHVWLPWSRLTYGAYLIHPIVMAIFYGSRHSTFEFSHFLMSYIALGNLVLTYVASLVLCVLFESPIIALEKLLTEGRSRSGSNTHVLPG
jgi:peptidoglycan/LPS O-acetylase OafA/YrhL